LNLTVLAVLIAVIAAPAIAGERFSGSHTYRADSETWSPVPAAGWRTVTMVGEYTPISGRIPSGKIECRGTNFWNRSIREADGVCVFGELPDNWMLRYRMPQMNLGAPTMEPYQRTGNWTVVGGNGRYNGITGSGTYRAKANPDAEGGKWRTMWEGEITIPK